MNRTLIKTLSYVGAAVCEGQPKAGVKKGPDVVRNSGLFETLKNIQQVENIIDYGNVNFESLSKQDQNRAPIDHMVLNLHKLDPLLNALNLKIQEAHQSTAENNMVVTVGGDHSIGSASVHAALTKYPDLKVIWVDAHADFVDPYLKNTPKQNYHGMPLSHISGVHTLPGFKWMTKRLKFENIVLLGIRDIDPDQYISLRKHKVKCFTIDHVQKYGIGSVVSQAMEYLDPKGNSPFHISYDVDGVDPYIVNQTGTVYRDGLNHRQACHIVKRLVHERHVVSMDVVEINPEIGNNAPRPQFRDEQYIKKDVGETVGVAVDLISSLFNKTFSL